MQPHLQDSAVVVVFALAGSPPKDPNATVYVRRHEYVETTISALQEQMESPDSPLRGRRVVVYQEVAPAEIEQYLGAS